MEKPSISRQFARWAAALKYEDLPPAVVEKIKAITLHALSSAVIGAEFEEASHSVDLTLAEEAKPDGASILGRKEKASRVGAVFANAELMHLSYMFDSYRMLTHPGPVLLPAALVNADLESKNGRDIIVALVAGYELICRVCDEFIPSTAARGFRPSPLYATLGAALVSGKLMGLDEDGLVTTIALAANFASGINEGPRVGSNELTIHEPQAARNAVFAAVMARSGHIQGAELSIEGPAGFYNAFTGSHTGKLTYAFQGPLQADLDAITAGLGRDYRLLTVMFRMYSNAGYNQPVIDLMTEMQKQHGLRAEDIADVAVTMNWLETLYPSPAFPRFPDWRPARVGTTPYFVAQVAVNGSYPQVGSRSPVPPGTEEANEKQVQGFMANHVSLVPQKDYPMFSPEIAITMKDGKVHAGKYPYARMEWNFEQLRERLELSFPDPGPRRARFEKLIELTRNLDRVKSAEEIFAAVR